MQNEIEENNRSEYPASRIVLDIMDLLNDMMATEFCFTVYWRTHCNGEPILSIDLWESDSPHNIYGTYDPENPSKYHTEDSIYPLYSGTAYYIEQQTSSLHRLYDDLFAIYQTRKPESPSPINF